MLHEQVWEATIGNMGRTIYVFEVQTKGSIDSLLMNLLKSLNNPAVQGVVAVSDKTQLARIEQEAAGVPGLKGKLKMWDYEEVLKVHELLESVIREWLMERMRLVALFDLPANVFAETGVNTSVIIAYKPKRAELRRLNHDGYNIFVRDIQRVGYEKRTSKRNVFFNPVYQIDETTFQIRVDAQGYPMLDEEFTETLTEFRQWGLGQEETLQRLFLTES